MKILTLAAAIICLSACSASETASNTAVVPEDFGLTIGKAYARKGYGEDSVGGSWAPALPSN